MKRRFMLVICFVLSSFLLLFLNINESKSILYAKSEEMPSLTLDFENTDNLPLNFRKTSDLSNLQGKDLDLVGLDSLNISGSAEFTSLSLLNLKENLNVPPPIVIVDLREEPHGFINGNAVSYSNSTTSRELTLNSITEKEKQLLSTVAFGKSISLGDGNHSLIPTLVENEETLIRPNNLKYCRIPIKENERPTDEMVDRFISFVTSLKKDTWLHFHCKMGDERTTTFMAMYDIIKNSNNTDLNNILARQEALGGSNLLNLEENDPNLVFIKNFYQYTRECNSKTSWTEWIEKNDIEPYLLNNKLPN